MNLSVTSNDVLLSVINHSSSRSIMKQGVTIPVSSKCVKLFSGSMNYDLPESRDALIASALKDANAYPLDNAFLGLIPFNGPLLITSYLRGTGTHKGEAIDFKPMLSKAEDAHHFNLSPLYNARIIFLSSLLDLIPFYKQLGLVLLIEENHIHLHSVNHNNASIVGPGIYVKLLFNNNYSNDHESSKLIEKLEGIKGRFNQTILPLNKYLDFIAQRDLNDFITFPRKLPKVKEY